MSDLTESKTCATIVTDSIRIGADGMVAFHYKDQADQPRRKAWFRITPNGRVMYLHPAHKIEVCVGIAVRSESALLIALPL